jgi:hypothetical protein
MKFAYFALGAVLASAIYLGIPKAMRDQRASPATAPIVGYTARTDTRPEPLPDPPISIGPAGSIVQDRAFGSRILRVTDTHTMPGASGVSLMTPGSPMANTWNKTATRFFGLTRGGSTPVFDFDPVQMKAHYTGLDLSQSPRWSEAEFSHVNPDIIYGIAREPGGGRFRFQQYDFSTRRVTDLGDPARCVKMEPGWGAMDLGVSADGSRFLAALGPEQDKDPIIYVEDLKLGCRWYNTLTGEVGGEWGPRGTISTPERYGVHFAGLSPSGDYVVVGAGGGARGGFWRVDSTGLEPCRVLCGGHAVLGYAHFLNNAASEDEADTRIRPLNRLNDPNSIIKLVPQYPRGRAWGVDRHYSWNNDDPGDTAPVCGSTYVNPDSAVFEAARRAHPELAQTAPPIARAWDNEVVCIETDRKAFKVWRFGHTFSTATNGFWSTPRGNVSQDGRFYMFTSDWLNTLGDDPDKKGHRVDIFVVELK